MAHTILSVLVVAFALTAQEPQKDGTEAPATPGQRGPGGRVAPRNGETQRGSFDRWPRDIGRPDASTPTSLSNIAQVQAELNLTADQKQAIVDLTKKLGDKQLQLYAEMQKRAKELNQEADKAVKQLLDQKQAARIDQLRWQRTGTVAILLPEVAEKLGLSEEQRTKLGKLQEDMRRIPPFSATPFGDRGPGGGSPGESGRTSSTRPSRDRILQDMLAVLTPEQKTKWEEMLGPKFEFPAPFSRTGGGTPSAGTRGASSPSPNFTNRIRSRPFELGQNVPSSRTNGQISMRLIESIYGPVGPFRYKSTVEALALTEDQANQIRTIGVTDAESIRKIADEQSPDASEKIAQTSKETREKLDKVLNDEQKAKLKKLTSQ